MTRARLRLPQLAAAALCAVALAGCVTLLPKSKPAQLYRFGDTAAAPVAQPHRGVGVFRTNGSFVSEADGDRILTVTGGKAAYVAQSRWVAPASVLFNEALASAFDADPGPVRLIARGQRGKADYALRLDVRNFETRYDSGPDAAPTVLVRAYAALTRSDQTTVGEQVFEARVPAADNRMGAIVAAYDRAVADVLAKLVAWTKASAR
ncbi:MAG: ABC-type transport auxiliary lipoprotein family protein [Phenylobacterium sp.]